jgi:acetoacetyl-CoA synthetase
MNDKPLWSPSPERVANANITAFMKLVNERHDLALRDYHQLYRWSIDQPEAFWVAMWDFGGVVAQTRGERVLAEADRMPGARFFPEAKLNFAENLLRSRDDTDAIVFWGEDKVRRHLTRAHRQRPRSQAERSGGVVVGVRRRR